VGPNLSLIQWVEDLSREKSGQAVALTTNPHLTPRLIKEYCYTSTPPLGLRGLFWGKLYLLLYINCCNKHHCCYKNVTINLMFVNVLFLDRKSPGIFHNIHSIFPSVVEFHLNHGISSST